MNLVTSMIIIGICVALIIIVIIVYVLTWIIGMGIDSSKNISKIGNALLEMKELIKQNNEQIREIKVEMVNKNLSNDKEDSKI